MSEKLVPEFTSEELSALEKACQGVRYDPHGPRRSDVDLWRREVTVRGKGGRPRVVRIGHETARAWTGTSAYARSTGRRTGRSCGWE